MPVQKKSAEKSASKTIRLSVVPRKKTKRRILDPIVTTADTILRAGGQAMVFTGAGVSAESGVPTYREPGGIWKRFDEKTVGHINGFLASPEMCWRFEFELWQLLKDVRPNAAHVALAEMEAHGFVHGVVTQNVDGLHQLAGSRIVHELHGNEMRGICLNKSCKQTATADDVFKSLGWIDAQGAIDEAKLPEVPEKQEKKGKKTAPKRSPSPAKRSSPRRAPKPGDDGPARLTEAALASAGAPRAKPASSGGASSGKKQTPRAAPKRSASPAPSAPSATSSASSSSSSGSTASLSSGVSGISSDGTTPDYDQQLKLPTRKEARARAPKCEECGGVMKPDAVYFGEALNNHVKKQCYLLSKASKVALVVGSSCVVSPANKLPIIVKLQDGHIVEVNPNPTIMTPHAHIHLQAKAGEVIPMLRTTLFTFAAATAAALVAAAASLPARSHTKRLATPAAASASSDDVARAECPPPKKLRRRRSQPATTLKRVVSLRRQATSEPRRKPAAKRTPLKKRSATPKKKKLVASRIRPAKS
ncbi:NAD-dependent protein deacylase 2 [Diplonema papillatum]|nr:NAD-dependent protein deacylase 2 [Diplonema papillatum]